jgi:hypothetical protein
MLTTFLHQGQAGGQRPRRGGWQVPTSFLESVLGGCAREFSAFVCFQKGFFGHNKYRYSEKTELRLPG